MIRYGLRILSSYFYLVGRYGEVLPRYLGLYVLIASIVYTLIMNLSITILALEFIELIFVYFIQSPDTYTNMTFLSCIVGYWCVMHIDMTRGWQEFLKKKLKL